jgi:molybdopterin-containing oxidoreductase family membrane subunit
MVVLPYYLHNFKAFGKIAILGEFLAIAAVTMCLLFIIVDLGQPGRAFNMILHPSPRSILFWDMIVLNGYLVLNVLISRASLTAERADQPPPSWVKPLIILSIPWAISIHTVTAFIYSGLAARPFWMTAILAPRFLASAFASGPALLILFCLLLRRITKFDAGWEAIQKLATIATYAVLVNIFFVLMEFFTAFYSAIPEHIEHFAYLYVGLEGHRELVPWMWLSAALIVVAAVMLLSQRLRNSPGALAAACVAIVASIWIEKGLGMIVTGFVPSPLGEVSGYAPTLPEFLITLGIYGLGALLVTVLYKVALSVRGQVRA